MALGFDDLSVPTLYARFSGGASTSLVDDDSLFLFLTMLGPTFLRSLPPQDFPYLTA